MRTDADTAQPIMARPPSAIYQLRYFAVRNKAVVAGAGVTLVALIAGLVVGAAARLTKLDAMQSPAPGATPAAFPQRSL